jgi:hypothetical protein
VIRTAAAFLCAVALSGALVAAYIALGGTDYAPAPVANPCAPRAWRSPSGVEETIEQIALSTADGAACKLHVSREDVVLALASGDDLHRFAQKHDVSQGDAESAIRAGLLRSIDDGERAGAIDEGIAGPLRTLARHFPIGLVLDALRGVSALIPG